MWPVSLPHGMLRLKLFISNWDNTCRSAPLLCACTVEHISSSLDDNRIQLVHLTYFLFFALFFLAAFLICAFLPVFNLISLGRLALVFLLFCSSAPTLTPFFTPYSSLFLESPFIPLLNICIHFSIEYKKIQCLILQLLTTRMTFTFSSLSDLPLAFFFNFFFAKSPPPNFITHWFIYLYM